MLKAFALALLLECGLAFRRKEVFTAQYQRALEHDADLSDIEALDGGDDEGGKPNITIIGDVRRRRGTYHHPWYWQARGLGKGEDGPYGMGADKDSHGNDLGALGTSAVKAKTKSKKAARRSKAKAAAKPKAHPKKKGKAKRKSWRQAKSQARAKQECLECHHHTHALDTHKVVLATARAHRVEAALRPVLENLAKKYNTSFAVGFADSSGSIGVAAGVNDRVTGAKLTPYTRIPLGSATKPVTAVQIMENVERGKLQITDLASKWVDQPLKHLYGKTFEDIFGPKVKTVTVRDLISMRSGLHDYDDAKLKAQTLAHHDKDLEPIDYIMSAAEKGMFCEPRTCTHYSGINFIMAGFVLLHLQGKQAWEDLDQMAVIPNVLRKYGHFAHTQFAKHGACTQYKAVSHQYDSDDYTAGKKIQDLRKASCLNGWTMGNIMTTGQDMATFYFDLFALAGTSNGLISKESLRTMLANPHPLSDQDDWCYGPDGEPGGCKYAMAFTSDQTELDVWPLLKGKNKKEVKLTGHNGQNWGSSASPCGFNAAHDFGVCVTFTSNEGLNSNLHADANAQGMDEVACKSYGTVLQVVLGKPILDCSEWSQ